VKLAQTSSLSTVAQLLCVDQTELGRALCHRVIAANGELMEKGHTASEAVFGRDALAKVSNSAVRGPSVADSRTADWMVLLFNLH